MTAEKEAVRKSLRSSMGSGVTEFHAYETRKRDTAKTTYMVMIGALVYPVGATPE